MMEEEEYRNPGSYAEEGDSWVVPPGSGIAYPVASVQACGLPSSRLGGAPAYAPLAWGSMTAAEYDQVTGWQEVTDLDGAGGQYIAGRLMAAWWGGRIWLKLTTSASTDDTADDAAEPSSGAGYVGTVSSCDLPTDAPGRAVLPQLYICPMDARENYLKTEQGVWRADVWWEVLANYSYHPEEGVFRPLESGGFAYKQAIRVTIWAVSCGNVLAFYTSASPMYTESAAAAPVAARLKYSAWGVPYEVTGYNLDTLTAEGGPFSPFWCAQLPWELDGSAPALMDDRLTQQPALGSLGTENYLGTADGIHAGHITPPAIAAPVHICGRFHYGDPWGIAFRQVIWPWEYGSAYGDMPSVSEFTGYDTWLDAVQGYMIDEAEPQAHAESAQDYCFDPSSIEGKGVLMGYHLGWYTPGDTIWPPTAAPYEVLTAAELASPFGKFYLAIGGTTADGVLLTASCFAEPRSGTGADSSTEPGPSPGSVPTPPTPDPDPPDPPPGPSPGPGPYNPPGPDDTDDPAPDAECLEDGYYFTGGKGIKVTAERTTVRVDGEVTAIRYDFDIDVTVEDLFYTAPTRYKALVNLATSNGGSYNVNGTFYTMYYGFSASSYDGSEVTMTWKSSYMYSDTDPKAATAFSNVVGVVTVSADFPQSGSADSESLPTSNILAIRNTGRTITRSSDGVKRQFHIYTIALKTETLKGIMLRKALNHIPAVQLDPASATGINSGPPDPPTVTASLGTVTIAHDTSPYTDYPSDVTGCLIPDIAADYSTNGGIIAGIMVSGSATWLYGDDTRANGSIDARFNITLPDQSANL